MSRRGSAAVQVLLVRQPQTPLHDLPVAQRVATPSWSSDSVSSAKKH